MCKSTATAPVRQPPHSAAVCSVLGMSSSTGQSMDTPGPSPPPLSPVALLFPSFFGVGGRPTISPALLCWATVRHREWGTLITMDEVGVEGVRARAPCRCWRGRREGRATTLVQLTTQACCHCKVMSTGQISQG